METERLFILHFTNGDPNRDPPASTDSLTYSSVFTTTSVSKTRNPFHPTPSHRIASLAFQKLGCRLKLFWVGRVSFKLLFPLHPFPFHLMSRPLFFSFSVGLGLSSVYFDSFYIERTAWKLGGFYHSLIIATTKMLLPLLLQNLQNKLRHIKYINNSSLMVEIIADL